MERQLGAVLRQIYSSMIIDEVRFGLEADVRQDSMNACNVDEADIPGHRMHSPVPCKRLPERTN